MEYWNILSMSVTFILLFSSCCCCCVPEGCLRVRVLTDTLNWFRTVAATYIIDHEVHDCFRDQISDTFVNNGHVGVHKISNCLHLSFQLGVHWKIICLAILFSFSLQRRKKKSLSEWSKLETYWGKNPWTYTVVIQQHNSYKYYPQVKIWTHGLFNISVQHHEIWTFKV